MTAIATGVWGNMVSEPRSDDGSGECTHLYELLVGNVGRHLRHIAIITAKALNLKVRVSHT